MPLWLLLPLTAWAHKPTFDGPFPAPAEAYPVDDPAISIAVYQELTCDDDQLWLTFEATEGMPLYLQVGVPVLDRMEGRRPAMALLAPGLPAVELPFDVPEGLGGFIYDAADVASPDSFYEPFTGTESWVWLEERLTLGQAGTGYVVAWWPDGYTGKMWVAMGEVEDFSGVAASEFAGFLTGANTFHETTRFEDAVGAPEPEQDCVALEEEASSGCNMAGGVAWSWVLVGGMVRRRRERAY